MTTPFPTPNSITGYTRDELIAAGAIIANYADAEAQFGLIQRHCAAQLPDGRRIHLTALERGWQWALVNPHNPLGEGEVSIFLTREGMEMTIMLVAICKEAMGYTDAQFFDALEAYIASAEAAKEP